MCEPVSIATAVVGTVSAVSAGKSKQKAWAAQETARRKQNIETLKKSNVTDSNLLLDQANEWEQARAATLDVSNNQIAAMSAVNNAAGESMLAGNSVDRVKRMANNTFSAQKVDITDTYERNLGSIQNQRFMNAQNTKSAIENSQAAPPPDQAGLWLGAAEGALDGYRTGQGIMDTFHKTPDYKPFESSHTNYKPVKNVYSGANTNF